MKKIADTSLPKDTKGLVDFITACNWGLVRLNNVEKINGKPAVIALFARNRENAHRPMNKGKLGFLVVDLMEPTKFNSHTANWFEDIVIGNFMSSLDKIGEDNAENYYKMVDCLRDNNLSEAARKIQQISGHIPGYIEMQKELKQTLRDAELATDTKVVSTPKAKDTPLSF